MTIQQLPMIIPPGLEGAEVNALSSLQQVLSPYLPIAKLGYWALWLSLFAWMVYRGWSTVRASLKNTPS